MADSNRQGGWPARWWGEFHFQNIISMRVGSQVNILRPIRVLELRSKTDPQSRSSDCSGEGPWHRMLTQCNEQQMPWPRDQKRHLQTKALRSMESIRVAPQTASLGWGWGGTSVQGEEILHVGPECAAGSASRKGARCQASDPSLPFPA